MNNRPPKWIDRFLTWYCNPELLEEIQGDALELYEERLQTEGRRKANFKYVWDILRFCRMSNIKRPAEYNEPGFFGTLWNLNMKIAIRNSMKNKTIFMIKLSALSICLAFSLLLSAFVINELTYDHQHADYKRIFRIGQHVEMAGKISDYAVSPLPMGGVLAEELSEVESYSRFMVFGGAAYKVGDEKFFDIMSYAADSNFLKLFNHDYIHGTNTALDDPNKIVLTESIAIRLFGSTDVVGKSVDMGWTMLEVGAIIRDLPANTHFTFDVLVSWHTFKRNDEWDNINAYTYVKTAPGVEAADLVSVVKKTADGYMQELIEEYQIKMDPIIQRVDEIHMSGFMDEDFAIKRSRNYVYIMMSIGVLFLLAGLFNYLNLALAELTTQIKKIAILRAFGGIQADHRKVALTDSLLCLGVVVPLVTLIIVGVISIGGFMPEIDKGSWVNPIFISITVGLVMIILFSSRLNGIVISRSELMISSLQGKSSGNQKGFTLRKLLVSAQLAFSIIMIGFITVVSDQFKYVSEADKGFNDQNIMVITRPGDYAHSVALEESLRKLNGVSLVAGSSFYPDGGVETKELFEIETSTGMKNMLVNYIHGQQDYASLLELEMVEGRFFEDKYSTDENGAYVINETAARQFGWKKPIGKKINGPMGADGREGVVVGVVKDFHFESMYAKIEPLIMFKTDQDWGFNFIYIKTDPLHTEGMAPIVEREYKKIFPDKPFDFGYLDLRYMSLYRNDYEVRDIFRWGLIISLIVSGLGIFSISALMLSLRTKEMGIRKVVGAENVHLFLMHLKPFAIYLLIALAIGSPAVFVLSSRWLDNFAYHIEMRPGYFILPMLLTPLVILIASGYHAFRGSRVNPIDILKQE